LGGMVRAENAEFAEVQIPWFLSAASACSARKFTL